jgi:hypothetical protein
MVLPPGIEPGSAAWEIYFFLIFASNTIKVLDYPA